MKKGMLLTWQYTSRNKTYSSLARAANHVSEVTFHFWKLNVITKRIYIALVLGLFVLCLFALMPLVNLYFLICGLAPSGWLCTWTLLAEYRSHCTEHKWEAACSLQNMSVTMCLPYISNHMVYLHLFKYFSVLPIRATITHPIKRGRGELTQK